MIHNESSTGWGYYAPPGVGKLLLLIKRFGYARGSAKKVLGGLWSYLRLTTPVDICYEGLKFRLHPWDNTVEYKMLFGSKQRDRLELGKLRQCVAHGGVFLDIGANIGYYALMAAQFGADKVLAFEPNPAVFSRLKFNIEANALGARIQTLQIALGDKIAMATMIASTRDMGGSHMDKLSGSAGIPISVMMKPLSDVLLEEGIVHIDALKIDVEGMEDAVLFPFYLSCPSSLWPRLVIIEHTSQQQWKRDILKWMMESGYREIQRNRSNAILCRD